MGVSLNSCDKMEAVYKLDEPMDTRAEHRLDLEMVLVITSMAELGGAGRRTFPSFVARKST